MAAPVESTETRDLPRFATWAVATVTITAGVVAALSATRYGYYYDELYFIAAGKHLAVSYADQGPTVPLLAVAVDHIASNSFFALRVPAVLAALATIVISALIARELGGGRVAQVLAAGACGTAPGILGEAVVLTTNVIDTTAWALLSWLCVRWVRTRHDRLLLAAVLVTVIALQVKWLVPVFWVAVLVAAGCVGPRALLRRPVLWAGAAAVAGSAIPMLIWQAHHGWPQVGMGSVIREQTTLLFGSVTFIPRAVQMCGVLGAVLLTYGEWRLWRSPRLRPHRFLGVALLIVAVTFALAGGRVEYGAGMYAAVLAVGAVEVSQLSRRRLVLAAVPVVAASIAAYGFWSTPWRPASQLSPAPDFTTGLAVLAYGEFGWSQVTSTVAEAYRALPPEQRRTAAIVTERYVVAGALDYYRSAAGLPPVFSPKRGYGYFGTPPDTAETVLWVGNGAAELHEWFDAVEPVGALDVRLGMPLVTRGVTIWKCSGRKQPWSSTWPRMQTL